MNPTVIYTLTPTLDPLALMTATPAPKPAEARSLPARLTYLPGNTPHPNLLQHAGPPCPTSQPSTEPTRKPILLLQALTTKIPSRLTLPAPLQAVMMMRMRTTTQTLSTSLSKSMNRIK
eukprot:6272735-Ditylum_brightwellii.AAC.1